MNFAVSGRSSTCGETSAEPNRTGNVRSQTSERDERNQPNVMTPKGATWTLQMQCRLLWALVEHLPDDTSSTTVDIDGRRCIALVQAILLLIPDWSDTDPNRERYVQLLTNVIDKLVDSLHLDKVVFDFEIFR